MAYYDYKCLECGTILEAKRKMVDRDNAPLCLDCGGITQRLISLVETNYGTDIDYTKVRYGTGLKEKIVDAPPKRIEEA